MRRVLALLTTTLVCVSSLARADSAQAAQPGTANKFSLWENDNYEGCGVDITSAIKTLSSADNCGENGIGRYDLNDRLSSS